MPRQRKVNCIGVLSLPTKGESTPTFFLAYLSRSLADRWGTTVDFTTISLHFSRFSAFRSMIFHSRPVHSLMLSSHRFLCLSLLLPPLTGPCWIVLASPNDRVTCPYHSSLRLFTEVWRSHSYFSLPVQKRQTAHGFFPFVNATGVLSLWTSVTLTVRTQPVWWLWGGQATSRDTSRGGGGRTDGRAVVRARARARESADRAVCHRRTGRAASSAPLPPSSSRTTRESEGG